MSIFHNNVSSKTARQYLFTVGLLILILGSLGFSFRAVASELRTYRLADLNRGETSLTSLLEPLDTLPLQDEHIKCEAYVLSHGRVARPYCYLPNRERTPFETSVLEALLEVKAKPALFNDRTKTVWLQFPVHLSSKDGSIVVTHDNSPSPDAKENSYKGPQRYHFPKRCRLNNKLPIFVNYRILRNGEIANIGFNMHDQETTYTKRAMRCFRQMRFFPAEKDGVAVEADVLEPVFSTYRTKILRRY